MSTQKENEQASELVELEDKEITEVSGAGIAGALAGARSAVGSARFMGGSLSQIVRAGFSAGKQGLRMDSSSAKEMGGGVGVKTVVGESGFIPASK